MQRLRPADVLAGIGGLVLFGSLSLTWYSLAFRDVTFNEIAAHPEPRYPTSAWQVFSITDIVLTAVAALAVSVPVSMALQPRRVSLPIELGILAALAGIGATLLILARLIFQPGDDAIVVVRTGAWVGLAGALLVTVGAWLSLADESIPGAVPPDVPRRPAPPAGLEP